MHSHVDGGFAADVNTAYRVGTGLQLDADFARRCAEHGEMFFLITDCEPGIHRSIGGVDGYGNCIFLSGL